MDAALQPSALPAALLNTRVKKIKRLEVPGGTQFLVLCLASSLHSPYNRKGRAKKKKILQTLTWIIYVHFCNRYVCAKNCGRYFKSARDVSHTGRVRWRPVEGWGGRGVRVWSCLLFQSHSFKGRERTFGSESYAPQIHGGSEVKGRGFNNITFLRFGVLALLDLLDTRCRQRCGDHQVNTGVRTSWDNGRRRSWTSD